ncbi:hypothetical protein, partial [Mycolicibacterium sp. CH28]|uniref:hypothetical protein n=1 Tax=Mycolicibacterium sp. CH28 TaxID=2512237 RepID=UPI001F252007
HRYRPIDTYASVLPMIRRCGCAMSASIGLSINRIHGSCDLLGWRRIDVCRLPGAWGQRELILPG